LPSCIAALDKSPPKDGRHILRERKRPRERFSGDRAEGRKHRRGFLYRLDGR
jgi:hypothetical protein